MNLHQKIKQINHPVIAEKKNEAKKMGADKLMSHAIAGRTLAQLGNGASKEMIEKDLQKTKHAAQLAQAAFFDKDPKAISLLQLNEDTEEDDDAAAAGNDTTDDEIYLFERAKDSIDGDDEQDQADLDEVIQLREAQAEEDEKDDSTIES